MQQELRQGLRNRGEERQDFQQAVQQDGCAWRISCKTTRAARIQQAQRYREVFALIDLKCDQGINYQPPTVAPGGNLARRCVPYACSASPAPFGVFPLIDLKRDLRYANEATSAVVSASKLPALTPPVDWTAELWNNCIGERVQTLSGIWSANAHGPYLGIWRR